MSKRNNSALLQRGGGGGTLLDSLSEGLENVEKITTQSKVEDVVKNTSPLAADFRKSEAEGETRNIRSSVVSNSKLNLRSERCHLMRGRNGRFAPQNDMVLNNPSRFTPHSSHRKPAFTMAEILIVIAIVGFVCMALMSVIRTAIPDYITVMKRKCYQILEDKVTQMYYDDDLYVRGTKRGFGNLQNIEHNGKTYGGDTKFCELFASTMNKWGGTTCEENKMTFKTADNVYWYLPVTDFSKGYAVVKFDVNGSKKPNCEYDAATCPKPDTFRYYVLGNGKISEHEPKPEEFDYCIKTIITGSGSVLPSAEYCELKNGTYELTSVPATGWSSPWAGNKKEVTVLDSDEVVYLNFTKEPEPTTPTSPTVPTTPTEPTTPDEPDETPYFMQIPVSMSECPMSNIWLPRSYDRNPSDERLFLVTSSQGNNHYYGKNGCTSKIELYINRELACTIDYENNYKNIFSYATTNTGGGYYFPDDYPLVCKNKIGYATRDAFYLIPTKSFNVGSVNQITVKITPRYLFNISNTTYTKLASCDSKYHDCTKDDSWMFEDYCGRGGCVQNYWGDIDPSYTVKAADSNGWLEVNGTKYKIVKTWPNPPQGKNKDYYDRYQQSNKAILEAGAETACNAIGAHAASQSQINKFRREISSIVSSTDFGCTLFESDNYELFGLDYNGRVSEGACPVFNGEIDNWSQSGYKFHGDILCVK